MEFKARKGQTMVEYVLAFCALVVLVGVLGWLLTASRRAVVRTESLVTSEYP
ncbi:MAG: hypothetical protein K6F50_06345 [Kiritimatiellae bacterium]|nr:hypothetical protein [Kiritimatiellia bacterium]